MEEMIGSEENTAPEMEERTRSEEDDAAPISIPLGGPIYVPNLVGSFTTVPDFEASVINLLQELEAELHSDSSLACVEISVDELKIFSEEELVNKALEVAFKVDDEASNSSQPCGQQSIHAGNKDAGPSHSGRCSKDNSKKRKNGRPRGLETPDDSYLMKVEKLAKIKEKQDEDKAAARLHSFNSSSKNNESAITSSDKIKKMTALRSTSSAVKVKSSNFHEHVAVHYPEVILCVEVYHNVRPWLKTQEFLVLGRQPLTELRDNIYCVMDQAMQEAEQHDPSGYFMIEDVFCNDMRDPSAIDYSEPIFDWLKNSKDEALEKWKFITSGELQRKQKAVLGDVTSQLPKFRAFDMHATRFCDLKFRLGANYLYCHQGDCKHTIVIRDLRLIHPEDAKNRAAYPLLTYQLKYRVRKCYVCKIYRATRVTVDDKWAKENPCYFCDNCYHRLHYSADNLLLYTGFEEYKYYHE